LNLPVFEVLLPSYVFSPLILILLPVLPTFFLPFFHEFLIVLEFVPILQALILLNGGDKGLLVLGLSQRIVEEVFLSDFESDEVAVLKFLFVCPHITRTYHAGLD